MRTWLCTALFAATMQLLCKNATAQEDDQPPVVSVVRICLILYEDGTSEAVYPGIQLIVRGTEGDRLYVCWTKRGWIDAHNVQPRSDNDVDYALKCKQLRPCRANSINYGAALYSIGDFEGALEQYEDALALEPDSPWSNNALGWFLAACPDDSLRDPIRAAELCKKACHLTNWEESMFIASLACACANIEDFESAETYIKRALLMDQKFRGVRAEILKCIRLRKPYRTTDARFAS